MFTVVDQLGRQTQLEFTPRERIDGVLLRNRIPPSSVIVLRDHKPVSDSHSIEPNRSYVASLIEGYDIATIHDVYRALASDDSTNAVYLKKRLRLAKNGSLEAEVANLTLPEVAKHVEDTIVDTCNEFELIKAGTAL